MHWLLIFLLTKSSVLSLYSLWNQKYLQKMKKKKILIRNYIWSKNISISSEGCFFISSTNGWWAEYNAFSARIKEITRWNRIWLYLMSRKQTFLVIDYNNTCFNPIRLCLSASSKILVAFSGVRSFSLKAALQRWNYKFISIERIPVQNLPSPELHIYQQHREASQAGRPSPLSCRCRWTPAVSPASSPRCLATPQRLSLLPSCQRSASFQRQATFWEIEYYRVNS